MCFLGARLDALDASYVLGAASAISDASRRNFVAVSQYRCFGGAFAAIILHGVDIAWLRNPPEPLPRTPKPLADKSTELDALENEVKALRARYPGVGLQLQAGRVAVFKAVAKIMASAQRSGIAKLTDVALAQRAT